MLVGQRRRLLNYLQQQTSRATAPSSRSSACASSRWASSPPGTPAPEFTLRREDGGDFTRDDLSGRTTVLVFYPFAFSAVCTDQLQIYEEALDELRAQGARDLRRLDRRDAGPDGLPRAARRRRSSSSRTSSPRARRRAPSARTSSPAGMTNRALVIVGPDGVVRWSATSPTHRATCPASNLIFDGLDARRPGAATQRRRRPARARKSKIAVDVAAHERAARPARPAARSRSRSAPCRA